MDKIYIYLLKDNKGTVRYVGKTNNPKSRLYSHIAEAKRKKSNRKILNWIRSLLSRNEKPVLEIIEICSHENWQDREKYWISFYRKKVTNLCNECDGGEGGLTRDCITKENLIKKSKVMSKTFSKFSEEEKILIWKDINNISSKQLYI